MSSRDKILSAVAANQPNLSALPDIGILKSDDINIVEKFIETLTAIGGKVIKINGFDEVEKHIKLTTVETDRVVSLVPELPNSLAPMVDIEALPRTLDNIELAVLRANIGVAENGAVWLNESQLGQRVTPFICQHLAVILNKSDIVPTMYQAYDKIGDERYGFATFIAGPSKTADIEQSLVLGAHGSRTMTVFLRDI
ncbi:MAG: LUD domain-containing protein [Mucilaginibacter sp.]